MDYYKALKIFRSKYCCLINFFTLSSILDTENDKVMIKAIQIIQKTLKQENGQISRRC